MSGETEHAKRPARRRRREMVRHQQQVARHRPAPCGAAPQSNVTIVIENGRLRDIGTGVAAPAGATVIDVTGKFVVPGIINGHGQPHIDLPMKDN